MPHHWVPQGLSSSMWAGKHQTNNSTTLVSNPPRTCDLRSRSVPPPESPQSTEQPATTTVVQTQPQYSTTTTGTTARGRPLTVLLPPALAFRRFEQSCQRLTWKSVDLENAYKRAMVPSEWNFGPAVSERNFKVDFHEFYVWIEQALVLALNVFGISIPRGDAVATNGNDSGGGRGGGGGGGGGGTGRLHASHQYHHNVLKALENEQNPLHEALGSGDTIQALWKAKELRNRWKDAEEKETLPLKMYNLHWIVSEVITGLSRAYGLAEAKVREEAATNGQDVVNMDMTEANADDGEWDWMTESMDWEA